MRGSPAETFERLVARGELVLGDGGIEEDGEDADEEPNDEPEPKPPAAEPFQLPSEVLSEFDDFGEDMPRSESSEDES